jgi:twitching motility protein PilT
MRQRFGWDLTARVIPLDLPTFEESGMPASCQALTKWAQGLVLVTGPAGCGKTTSLNILVEMINGTRNDHIITIEDPIEYIFSEKSCQITQREIGLHTLSQSNALRAALREDPDILVVSELRDLNSIQLAVSAAETGHLVFGTMNTNDAAQTLSKLIDSFPPDEQSVIRNMVSESLRGVISQQLIPRKDGAGQVPAFEVLIVNTAIANMIRSNQIGQVTNAMATNKSAGMVLLDHSLRDLVQKGLIRGEEAFARAISPANFSEFAPIDGVALG